MYTLEDHNRLKLLMNGYLDGDGDGLLIDILQALIPALPPMVGKTVSEFLHTNTEPNHTIHSGDM